MLITLLGNPISSQHLYGQKGKIRYMKSDAKQLKESYIRQIRIQYSGMVLTIPLRVKIRLYFKDKRKRDWDNWHKLSMDAMEGIIFENDSQLDSDGVQRYFGDTNPRIEIEIYDESTIQ